MNDWLSSWRTMCLMWWIRFDLRFIAPVSCFFRGHEWDSWTAHPDPKIEWRFCLCCAAEEERETESAAWKQPFAR